jgi:hypothetical protein
MSSASRLHTSFAEFIATYDGNAVKDGDPLIRYIHLWLCEGDATVEAGGDFSTFLRGVLYIIAWSQGSGGFRLDFRGSPGKKPIRRRTDLIVIDPDQIDRSPVFDPAYFKSVLLRRIVHGSNT